MIYEVLAKMCSRNILDGLSHIWYTCIILIKLHLFRTNNKHYIYIHIHIYTYMFSYIYYRDVYIGIHIYKRTCMCIYEYIKVHIYVYISYALERERERDQRTCWRENIGFKYKKKQAIEEKYTCWLYTICRAVVYYDTKNYRQDCMCNIS